MIALSNSQSTRFNLARSARIQFFAFQLKNSKISVMRFENLHVIDMTISNFSKLNFDNARMKSMMIV
jgi:hypothetical protein